MEQYRDNVSFLIKTQVRFFKKHKHSATQCNTVQHSATQCNTVQHSAFEAIVCLIFPLALLTMVRVSRVSMNGRLSINCLKIVTSGQNGRGADWCNPQTKREWIKKIQKCIRASVRHIGPYRGQPASPCRQRQFLSAVKKACGLWAVCVNRMVYDRQRLSFRAMSHDLAVAIAGIFPGLAIEHDLDSMSFYCASEEATHPIVQRDVDILNVANF